MSSICFYFQAHQPFRIKPYTFFDIGEIEHYEFNEQNRTILNRVADECYLPANQRLLSIINSYKGEFKVNFSISGTLLEQFEMYRPDVLDSFKKLAQTGCVEFLSETYYHSLSSVYSINQFKHEVSRHKHKIEYLFGQIPKVFRNTELIYNDDIGKIIEHLGFTGILCEGVERYLKGRSPNFLYHPPETSSIKCLLKNYRLSDDIAFRFSDTSWDHYPLKASKFVRWLKEALNIGEVINLFMDYETFGEHHKESTGILDFLEQLPIEILSHGLQIQTVSEVIDSKSARGVYKVPEHTSWADEERDLSAWQGNALQKDALYRLYELEKPIYSTGNKSLCEKWSKLQTSDHFYYMGTKNWPDGGVHQYFSPFESPYDAYIYFMNIIKDIELQLKYHKSIKEIKNSKNMKQPWLN